MLRILKLRSSFVVLTKVCKTLSLYSTSSISSSSKIIMKSPHTIPALSSDIVKQSLPQFLLDSFKDGGVEKENLVAMIDGGTGQEMTFGDIHLATTRYANAIQKLGYGGNNKCCIAIMSPNHRHFFTVFHGTGLAGAYTTTVNPLYTKDEIKFQVQKTDAKIIFAHPFCLELANQVGIELGLPVMSMEKTKGYVCVDDLIESESNEKVDMHSFPVYRKNFDSNEELMTIPFSSGTTGVPKGVMLTHKNLVANVLQAMPYEGDFLRPTIPGDYSTRGTVLVPLPFFHIYGMIAGMCMPLYAGGKLIFMSAFDLPKYLQLIQDHKVTRSHIVPPIILGLAKHPIIDKYDLSSLKCLMSGAAPLGAAMQIAAAERLGCIVKQAWGMTEISPCGSITPDFAVKSVHDIKGKSGLLVPGTEAKIVDPVTGEDLPYTSEGEILIRGPQVMKGYYKNEVATKATIRPDGWLHTGDIGLFDNEGWLYITDRCKELIKYKGFQVPPAELEAYILSIPQVIDCVVIPVEDEEAGELPRAYVVRDEKQEPFITEQQIIDIIQAKVAPHKRLRGGVVFTDVIPKSASGKLLRRVQILKDREINKK